MRILFTTVGLSGHLFPLVPLAWAAQAAGHDVLVATAENFVPVVRHAGLPVVPCGPVGGLPDLTAAGVVDPAAGVAVSVSMAEQRYAHGRAFGRTAGRRLTEMVGLVASWRPDLLVSERAEFAGPVAAAVHGVAHVEFHWGVAPLAEYRSAVVDELGEQLAGLGLDGLPAPALVLNPWPPSLRLAYAAGHRNLRQVPYNGDALVPDWVLRPREVPRVCLTLGTVLPTIGDDLAEIVLPVLERLARLDAEVVVAVDDKVAAGWPPLPGAVRHAGRMPLSHVLRASDVLIGHGGNSSTLTALEAGTPQLVLPQFDDQFDNAQAVEKAGAGVCLLPEEATPRTIASSCRDLLSDELFGTGAADIAAEIAAQPSPTDTVRVLESLAA